jgi:hypothetical protein
MATVYYFGCIDTTGHYMHPSTPAQTLEERRAVSELIYTNPWRANIDSGLCPVGPEIEGLAVLRQKDGWTVLSFWDRSVDHRGKSNSNFLAQGIFTFDEMIGLAQEHFPQVMKRLGFVITQVIP